MWLSPIAAELLKLYSQRSAGLLVALLFCTLFLGESGFRCARLSCDCVLQQGRWLAISAVCDGNAQTMSIRFLLCACRGVRTEGVRMWAPVQDELQHDVTDELAAYKPALPFPGVFGVFCETHRPTKNSLEKNGLRRHGKRCGSTSDLELLQKTFDGME